MTHSFPTRRSSDLKQQGLPSRRQFGTDILDVRDEAHVEHPVGFVDHEQVATGEQDLAALEQIHQAARRRDQHVDALLERLDLVAHLRSEEHTSELQSLMRISYAVFCLKKKIQQNNN